MGQLVLLVVAAAWAAVLVPPLLRSRIENRPNSSVSDFRNQLSSLQRAMPSRAVSRCGRWRGPWPRRRSAGPAAAGRPPLRSGVAPTAAQRSASAAPRQPARRPASACTTPRPGARSHGGARRRGPDRSPPAPLGRSAARDAVKRRRANVLFVLVARRRLLAVPRRHDQVAGDDSTCSAARSSRCVGYVSPARPAAASASRSASPSRGRRHAGRAEQARRRTRPRRRTAGASSRAVAPPASRPPAGGRTAGRTPSEPPQVARRTGDARRRRATAGTLAPVLGAVAQLVERNNRTVEARGSIPLSSTDRTCGRRGAVAQSVGAQSHCRGQGLDSPQLDAISAGTLGCRARAEGPRRTSARRRRSAPARGPAGRC